ncbi:pyocin knob domain-containing protein [Brenneria populi subsp. brevivirga]|uniref:pyocin knob domain-containing protein n=1 Tax=Brenneria populi TaxID=1505588 RepID=UPI002E19792F|nr:pyocin knob domain-containing protein [Brenneria populi subsp. brevivirga]
MKQLMPPIDTSSDNTFHDGNPLTGELGTIVSALFMNNVQGVIRNLQSELINVMQEAGVDIDESNNSQVLSALQKLFLTQSLKSLATEDLNTITTPGRNFQSVSANATVERNYPVSQAGMLDVIKTSGNGIRQAYYPYNSTDVYHRYCDDIDLVQPVFSDWEDINKRLASSVGASMIGLAQGGTVQDSVRHLTPEMFGAIGDGVNDDYIAIQKMFDYAPSGSTIVFDGRKTYLNKFSDEGGVIKNWTINKPLTVFFNNALLTRQEPVKTIDEQTALLYVTGREGRVYLYDFRGDGNNKLGKSYKNDGSQLTEGYDIALSQAINYGIWVQNTKDIVVQNCQIQRCAFNIWATGVVGLTVTGCLSYSGQVIPNITSNELALGAGIKLSNCSFFNINVRGKRNTHATVEIEPNNNYGVVRCVSAENLNSGLTIMDSSHIDFSSITDGTQNGPGTQIYHSTNVSVMRGIIGNVISDNCQDSGLRVYVKDGVAGNLEGITLDVQTKGCKTYGCDIRNYSSDFIIDGLQVRYSGQDNVSRTSGNDLWVRGDVRGEITGKSKGCYCGVIVNGSNSKYGIHISMDLQETASIAYSQGTETTVDWTGTKTSNEYKILPNVANLRIARSAAGGDTMAFGDAVLRANHFYFQGLPQSGVFAGEAWYDAANANTLKIYNPS